MVYSWCHEIELLLACARRTMRHEDVERARRAISNGVDWGRVLEYGRAHRLLPLLHAHAAHLAMPAGSAATLQGHASAVVHRNLRLSAELLAILRAFDAAGVRAVPLKGPLVAEQVFGSVGLREFGDLDLLVAAGHLPWASALLQRRDYVQAVDLPAGLHEGDLMHHVSFRSASRRIRVELHHVLMPAMDGRAHGIETLRLRTATFMGLRVQTLPVEDLFAYLCQHGGGHAWSRLEWLATVAELLRSGQVRDWARVESAAASWEGGRRVTAARLLARELFDGLEDVPALPASRSTRKAADAVIGRLVREPGRGIETAAESWAFQSRTDADVRTRLRRARSVLLSPHLADVQAVALPRARWPIYAVMRPLRLLVRWGSGRR